jgi:hypothetical protein
VRSATTAPVCANSIGSGNVPVHGWQRLDGSSVRQMKALQKRYYSPIQRRERQYIWRCSAVTINQQTQGTTARKYEFSFEPFHFFCTILMLSKLCAF